MKPKLINEGDILTLKEVAALIKISMGRAYQTYYNWPKYGVRILRAGPNYPPRFYKHEILRMMEMPK